MKIYTKTGDNGTTGLFAGPRVGKDHPRICAYGTVDELNATIGVVVSSLRDSMSGQVHSDANKGSDELADTRPGQIDLEELLVKIQHDLFSIGAQLATPDPESQNMCLLKLDRVVELEHAIDSTEDELEPLSNFIIPGGSMTASLLQLSRTVCRRAERDVVSLSTNLPESSFELPIIYLNRLSDLLFLLARISNSRLGIADPCWKRPDGEAPE